jgi:anti-sigma factor RsiW
MTSHDDFRKLLPLAAAGALDAREQRELDAHLRDCPACAAQVARYTDITAALRRLPTPQPSPAVAERARARAQAELATQADERWNYQVLAFLVMFSWTLVLASWPIIRLMTEGIFSWLELRQTWVGLAGFTVSGWMGTAVAAGFLGWRQRAARRTT